MTLKSPVIILMSHIDLWTWLASHIDILCAVMCCAAVYIGIQ